MENLEYKEQEKACCRNTTEWGAASADPREGERSGVLCPRKLGQD